jgi:Putative sensor
MTTQPPTRTAVAPARRGPDLIRLRFYRNPVRLLFSASPWRSAWFLFCYLIVGWLFFSAVVATASAAAFLAITLAGIPLILGAVWVFRGCANAERWRLSGVLGEHLRGGYRPVAKPGIMAQIRTRWRDPATWRDVAYLGGMFVPLVILDAAALVIWGLFLAGVTLPLWYWVPKHNCIGSCAGPQPRGVPFGYFPHGPSGPGATGLYVDTLPKALLAALGFLVLLLVFDYALVATARAHARVARALLRPPTDPLAEAREMLARPGPLAGHPLADYPADHPARPRGHP